MPVKLARLGLGESPWEHVRNHAFEWERESRGKKAERRRRKKAGCKKAEREKAGRHSPSR